MYGNKPHLLEKPLTDFLWGLVKSRASLFSKVKDIFSLQALAPVSCL